MSIRVNDLCFHTEINLYCVMLLSKLAKERSFGNSRTKRMRKNNLLRCINRSLKPNSGTIEIDGRHLQEMSTKDIAGKSHLLRKAPV